MIFRNLLRFLGFLPLFFRISVHYSFCSIFGPRLSVFFFGFHSNLTLKAPSLNGFKGAVPCTMTNLAKGPLFIVNGSSYSALPMGIVF